MGITSSSLGAVSQWNDHEQQRSAPEAGHRGERSPPCRATTRSCSTARADLPEVRPVHVEPAAHDLPAGAASDLDGRATRFFDGNVANVDAPLSKTPASPTISISASSAGPSDSNLAVGAYGAVAAVFNGASSVIQVNGNAASDRRCGRHERRRRLHARRERLRAPNNGKHPGEGGGDLLGRARPGDAKPPHLIPGDAMSRIYFPSDPAGAQAFCDKVP
jgi:hypothetical protein